MRQHEEKLYAGSSGALIRSCYCPMTPSTVHMGCALNRCCRAGSGVVNRYIRGFGCSVLKGDRQHTLPHRPLLEEYMSEEWLLHRIVTFRSPKYTVWNHLGAHML